jgi:hypothetical protein
MTASQTVPLDNQLCFSIYSAAIAINRAYKPLLDQLGVTYPQYLVLSTLWEAGGQTIGGIADRLDLEPSTITPWSNGLRPPAWCSASAIRPTSARSSSI